MAEPQTNPETWLNNQIGATEAVAERLRAFLAANPQTLQEVGPSTDVQGYTRPYSEGFEIALQDGSRLVVMVMALRPDADDPRYGLPVGG